MVPRPHLCKDGFECRHHLGWFRVECGGAACTLVLVCLSIRLRKSSEFGQERFSTTNPSQQLVLALTVPEKRVLSIVVLE
jgi:hypothetical protein